MAFSNYCSGVIIYFTYNYLIVDGKKIIYQLRKYSKICEINLRLKPGALVPKAASSCTAGSHMYSWTLRN